VILLVLCACAVEGNWLEKAMDGIMELKEDHDICEQGDCAECKVCRDNKEGECAKCWAKDENGKSCSDCEPLWAVDGAIEEKVGEMKEVKAEIGEKIEEMKEEKKNWLEQHGFDADKAKEMKKGNPKEWFEQKLEGMKEAWDICNEGDCASCKACHDNKEGECAKCWTIKGKNGKTCSDCEPLWVAAEKMQETTDVIGLCNTVCVPCKECKEDGECAEWCHQPNQNGKSCMDCKPLWLMGDVMMDGPKTMHMIMHEFKDHDHNDDKEHHNHHKEHDHKDDEEHHNHHKEHDHKDDEEHHKEHHKEHKEHDKEHHKEHNHAREHGDHERHWDHEHGPFAKCWGVDKEEEPVDAKWCKEKLFAYHIEGKWGSFCDSELVSKPCACTCGEVKELMAMHKEHNGTHWEHREWGEENKGGKSWGKHKWGKHKWGKHKWGKQEGEKNFQDADGCFHKFYDGEFHVFCNDEENGWYEKKGVAVDTSAATPAAASFSKSHDQVGVNKGISVKLATPQIPNAQQKADHAKTVVNATAVVSGVLGCLLILAAMAVLVMRRRTVGLQKQLDYEMNDARNLATSTLGVNFAGLTAAQADSAARAAPINPMKEQGAGSLTHV